MNKRKKQKKRNPVPLIVLTIVAILAIAVAVVGIADNRTPIITLDGGDRITLEYGSRFSDPGYRVGSTGSVFGQMGWPFGVYVRGYVNTTELGEYSIIYSTEFLGKTTEKVRTINVIDSTAPVITLDYQNGYSPSWFYGYQEEGYHAMDDHDGDLTNRVIREEKEDSVIYTVTDNEGNTSSIERKLTYTVGRPSLTLYGDTDTTVTQGTAYTDPGFSAYDIRGNDLTGYISVNGQVNTDVVGDYVIRYSVSNVKGEVVSAERCVHVKQAERPTVQIPDGKVIYLTFDDGPGPYTGKLLDILARYGVKATFFVTGDDPAYNDLIGRASREGHAIGVHTMSHNYQTIYASEDAFLQDFNATEQLIYEQTGSYSYIFRFPGGSSNTVSSFNPGIMSRLSEKMQNMGYQYFDWNVLSGDAGETESTRQVYLNIINGCSQNNINVVLQHDIKNFSVDAVEDVILWGWNNGYTFLPLNYDSYTAHHSLNN